MEQCVLINPKEVRGGELKIQRTDGTNRKVVLRY